MKEKPHHTGIFCDFISNFNRRIDIFNKILDFIKSADSIYDWQTMKLLQCLLRFDIDSKLIDNNYFVQMTENKNNHTLVRCYYLLLSGKYGNNRDRDLLLELYNEREDDYFKISLILAVQELGEASRNTFYNRIKNDSELIANFISYVRSLKKPLYYLNIEKPKIDTYKEYEPDSYGS